MSAELLRRWCEPRDIDPALMLENGFRFENHQRYGAVAALGDYRFANGECGPRRILILDPDRHEGRPWRWEGGSAKGAVWALGDSSTAEFVIVAEGESDGLAAWSVLCDDRRFAVLVVPGSNMVGDDLGNFVASSAQIVIATDADDAGDKCASACITALLGASHPPDLIRRLRPEVPGYGRPDLRDFVTHVHSIGEPLALLTAIINAPVMQPEPGALREVQGSLDDASRAIQSPFVRATDVVERPVEWSWHRRLPKVGLVVMAGDGGVGKSTLAQKVGAAMTNGVPLPFGGRSHGPRGVLMLSAEEDTGAVIRPRMRLMGANLDRVMFLDPDHGANFMLPSGIDQLEAACCEIDAGIVVIDSGPAFMDKGLKNNDEGDIRKMLRPLNALAERRQLLIVVLAHLNKGQGAPGQRVMGGAAWRNAPRLLLMVGVPDQQHPSDTDQRMIVVEKSNLGRFPDAVGFQLVTFSENADLADIVWGEEHRNISAGDLVTAAADPEERSRIKEAIDWLADYLADGPRPAGELLSAARKDGVADRTLRRASVLLRVEKRKAGFDGGWIWSLPEAANEAPSAADVATFAKNQGKPPANGEVATRVSSTPAVAPSGLFGQQAVLETQSVEDGQLSSTNGTVAALDVPRLSCKWCGDSWPSPGSVCDWCLEIES